MKTLNVFSQKSNKLFDSSVSLSLSLWRGRLIPLLLPVFLALTFSMCTKNETVTHANQIPTTDQNRHALLNDIIGKTGDIRNAEVTLRTQSTYTVNEALELLDESLNYAYCRPGAPFQYAIILADTLFMEVIDEAVTEAEIADLFDEASLNIGTQFHDLSLTNKEPWAFFVGEFGSIENNELPIIVHLEVAYGDSITARNDYEENEDYSYLVGGGSCNSTQVDGAPEILSDNLKLAYVYNPPNTNKYFKRGEYVWLCNEVGQTTICHATGIPNNIKWYDMYLNQSAKNPQNWNNINDWRLFRQHEGITANFDRCLSGDVEMPFQEEEMGDFITYYLPGVSYYPINLWVGSMEVNQNDKFVPFHNMMVSYYQQVTVGPEDPKISLPDCCP